MPATHRNKSPDYKRARELRRTSSPYEQKLWKELQQLYKSAGIKFRRQQPLSPYIVDFACMEARLIVELDGMSHDMRQEHDQKRDAYLHRLGFKTLRFSNAEVAANLEDIVATMVLEVKTLMNRTLVNDPSPAKTKDLLGKPKFLLPLPQGERNGL